MELNGTPDRVHLRYALWLAWGMRVGLAVLVAGFTAYAFGLAPHVPLEQLPALWQRPSVELLRSTGLAPGWHWATLLYRSDMLVIAGIALLASCSIPCLAAVVPLFARRGERILTLICVLQIAVLVLAASGVLAGGH